MTQKKKKYKRGVKRKDTAKKNAATVKTQVLFKDKDKKKRKKKK